MDKTLDRPFTKEDVQMESKHIKSAQYQKSSRKCKLKAQ